MKELRDLPPLPVLDLPCDKITKGFPSLLLRISCVCCCLSLCSSEKSLALSSPRHPTQDLQAAARPPLRRLLLVLDKGSSLQISPYIVCCSSKMPRPTRTPRSLPGKLLSCRSPHLVLVSGLCPAQGQDMAAAFTRSASFLRPAPVSLSSSPVLPRISCSSSSVSSANALSHHLGRDNLHPEGRYCSPAPSWTLYPKTSI